MTELTLTRAPKRLDIEAPLPEGVTTVELRLESTRNQPLVRDSDRSPNAPDDFVSFQPDSDAELWLPTVDTELEHDAYAVALFENPEGTCAVNAHFGGEEQPLVGELTIPAERLEHWENAIWTSSSAPHLARFEMRKRFVSPPGLFAHTVHLLSDTWGGTVSLWGRAAEGEPFKPIATRDVPPIARAKPPARPATDLSLRQLYESLEAAIGFVLRCRNTAIDSRTAGGFFLLYDVEARTFRTSHWLWTWGVTARMLLDASRLPEIETVFGPEPYNSAVAAGLRALEFQWNRPGHPADGLVTVRWNPGRAYPLGFREFVSTADASFLAGWAWAPLYEATGDAAFLDSTTRLCEAIERLSREHDVVPLDWLPETNDWKTFVLNEAGFGTEAFAELHRITGEGRWREAGCRYMDQLLAKFEREDGLWDRSWERDKQEVIPCQFHARGQGWAMEGLMAAHRMAPDGPYLEKARRLAEAMIGYQREDGGWPFTFNDPKHPATSEKGTALWSYLLYRLFDATKDDRYRDAARRALRWCIDHQQDGADPDASGSIVGCSLNSGIVYRYWFPIACLYTSSFMGLALMEEIRLTTE